MEKGLMIDIDDTLSLTAAYWMEYLQSIYGNPENITPMEMFRKYHSVQQVPYWQGNRDINQHIYKLIYSNYIQLKLPVFDDSNLILNEMANYCKITCYLTKRPEKIKPGTISWLEKHNFPPAPVICMPNNVKLKNGNLWKAKVINDLSDSILAVIDDDKRLIYELEKYKSIHYFLITKENFDYLKLKVYPCSNWKILKDKFEKIFL